MQNHKIDELEKAAKKQDRRRGRPWTDAEDALILEYYLRVPHGLLLKYLLPGRTIAGLQNRVTRMRGSGAVFRCDREDSE